MIRPVAAALFSALCIVAASDAAIMTVYDSVAADPNLLTPFALPIVIAGEIEPEIGDVLNPIGHSALGQSPPAEGQIEAISLSVVNMGDPDDPNAPDLLEVTVRLFIYPDPNEVLLEDPNLAVGTLTRTIRWYEDETPEVGLPPGQFDLPRIDDLELEPEALGIDCNFVLTQKFIAARWSFGSTGRVGVLVSEQTPIGESGDFLWLNNGVDTPWFYNAGAATANVAYVVELQDAFSCITCTPGDANCDGAVNFADIDPFVMALTDPTGYAARYPDCDRICSDISGDGAVNFADIDPFVALLTGG